VREGPTDRLWVDCERHISSESHGPSVPGGAGLIAGRDLVDSLEPGAE
jgi:hypothetical protein